MRAISEENYAALQARQLVARDFIWFKARTFDTGAQVDHGFWSDIGNVAATVINPETGAEVTRTFEGAGSLIAISDIPLVSNVTVRSVTVTLSQIDEGVANLVRGYDLKQARVEIFRGLFSPETRKIVGPAFPRFVGFVDDSMITTPAENEDGSIVLTCVSHTQEMTRSNPDTRSNGSQKLRSASDNFFQDATTVGEWELFWGQTSGKIPSSGPQRITTSIPANR